MNKIVREKVLIADPSYFLHPFFDEKVLEKLEKKFQVKINQSGKMLNQEELILKAKDCVAVIAGMEKYDQFVLEQLPNLKQISRAGTGMDNIDLKAAEKRQIKVSNVSGVSSQAVAELTLGLILSLLRNIPQMDKKLKQQDWKPIHGEMLLGKTVGIIGLGEIGRRVAILLKAFEANVIGHDMFPNTDWCKTNQISLKTKDEILKQAEILILSLSYNPANRHMIGEKEFKAMKQGARIVNLSRGGLIDEEALIKALTDKKISGAALDVFETEPYTGKLTKFKQVVLTPHIGASTIQSRKFMQEEAINNLLDKLK